MAKRNDNEIVSNRVLVCDDDVNLIEEYKRCLGQEYIEEVGATTLTDLEKVLFGDESGESGATGFDLATCNQGEAAVEAVEQAIDAGKPFSIVFIDIRMPPGMDGVAAAKRIRELDPNINIVVVTGSIGPELDKLDVGDSAGRQDLFFQESHSMPPNAGNLPQLCAANGTRTWHYGVPTKSWKFASKRVPRRCTSLPTTTR